MTLCNSRNGMALASTLMAVLVASASATITSMSDLRSSLTRGPLRDVAVLAPSNVDSVRAMLPNVTSFVVCDGVTINSVSSSGRTKKFTCTNEEMLSLVDKGTVLAAVLSGGNSPASTWLDKLTYFGAPTVSTRAIMMRPDDSSADLALAVDAALAHVWYKGKDVVAREANQPLDYYDVQSCQRTDMSAYTIPNRSAATGLLRTVLDTGSLVLGGLNSDWGNVGNYSANPPTGFYPDFMTAFCEEFNSLAGVDGVSYGPIVCSRRLSTTSAAVFKGLFHNLSHIMEPYYVIDADFSGTGEACNTTLDCSAPGDWCKNSVCVQSPVAPRSHITRLSCTTFGIVSFFITKRSSSSGISAWLAGVIAAAVIVLVALVTLLGGFVGCLIRRERRGQPVFRKIVEEEDQQGDKPVQESVHKRAESTTKEVEVDSL